MLSVGVIVGTGVLLGIGVAVGENVVVICVTVFKSTNGFVEAEIFPC